MWHLLVSPGHPCPCSTFGVAVGMCRVSLCAGSSFPSVPVCPQTQSGPGGSRWSPVPPAPPTFTETPPQYVEAKEGSSVTLTCMAFGNPKPIVTWLREGDLLGANGKYQVGGEGLGAVGTPGLGAGRDSIDRTTVAGASCAFSALLLGEVPISPHPVLAEQQPGMLPALGCRLETPEVLGTALLLHLSWPLWTEPRGQDPGWGGGCSLGWCPPEQGWLQQGWDSGGLSREDFPSSPPLQDPFCIPEAPRQRFPPEL